MCWYVVGAKSNDSEKTITIDLWLFDVSFGNPQVIMK